MKLEINKIDFELKNLFENVSIKEISNKNRFYIKVQYCNLCLLNCE